MFMKRFILISAAALAAMCISFSCQKEEQTGDIPGKGKILTVTAKIGNVSQDTKTYIDGAESPIKTYWSEGDKITLFDEWGNTAVYKINNWTEKQTSAVFVLDDGQTALSGIFHCACYPADSAKWESENVVFGLPSVQAYVSGTGGNSGSFGNGAAPMVATGILDETKGNLDLTFKNACGVLQLNLTSSEVITRIAVASLDKGYYLFGDASIFEIEEPTCSLSQGYHQIEMDIPPEEAPSSARAYYMVLPETKSHAGTAGLRIAVTTTGGLYYKDLTTRITRDTITCLAAKNVQTDFTKAVYSEASDSAAVMIEGIIWAPVNCGYDATNYKYGMLYQWGRKYGQGYNGGSYVDGDYPGKSGGNQSCEFIDDKALTSYPDNDKYNGVFYCSNKINNWYGGSSPAPDSLWKKTKTSYDPCPEGWRVPTYDELNALIGGGDGSGVKGGWDDTNKGYWFNGTKTPKLGEGLFLQAAGRRNGDDHEAVSRGSSVTYSSSSVFDDANANPWGLYTDNAASKIVAEMGHLFNRMYGLSVRCVKE